MSSLGKGLLMFGLHILDLLVMVVYFVLMIVIGLHVSKEVKNYEDFVMGGRQMGRWLQTFMNFGTGTSADTAVDAARETFRQGYAGLWLKLYVLFIMPFYWITTIWLRRLRLSSMPELFKMRHESPLMERVYALLGLLSFMATISISMLALQKTAAIIMIRTVEVRASASRDDVAGGHARYEGQRIAKTIRIAPVGVFFEHVVSSRVPRNSGSFWRKPMR
jgi:Na+/proline symporter